MVEVERRRRSTSGSGFAVRTDPPSGTSIPKGSTITLYVL